jgi:predicted acyltransferase
VLTLVPPYGTVDNLVRIMAHRLLSLDAFRGLAVALMVVVDSIGVLGVAPAVLRHAPWHGLTLADVTFPMFLFAVGVALPFSSKAESPVRVLRRVALLILIGIALTSWKYGHLVVAGVLQHVAGSYLVGWLLLRLPWRAQIAAVFLALALQWAAFTFVDAGGIEAGSWAAGQTPAAWVDTLLLGRPHTEGVWAALTGGITVLLGAWVGRLLASASRRGEAATRQLATWAAALTAGGTVLALVIPLNKKLWTPSFTLLTAGISAFVLLALHLMVDGRATAPAWVRPFLDLGRNALAIFVLLQVLLIATANLVRPIGTATLTSIAYTATLLVLCWSVAAWLRSTGRVITV